MFRVPLAFKPIQVYNLKTKSNFGKKGLHYTIGYIINSGPKFFIIHWFWIWHKSSIPCDRFEVYMTIPINACSRYSTVQLTEVLLNIFGECRLSTGISPAKTKEVIKYILTPRHRNSLPFGPFRGESTGKRRIPLTKGQWCGTWCFISCLTCKIVIQHQHWSKFCRIVFVRPSKLLNVVWRSLMLLPTDVC